MRFLYAANTGEFEMKVRMVVMARAALLLVFLMVLAFSACKKPPDEPSTPQSHPGRLKKPDDVQKN
jgi:hypothetical protein